MGQGKPAARLRGGKLHAMVTYWCRGSSVAFGFAPSDGSHGMFRLLRHFSIVCALALAVIVAGLAYLYWSNARNDLILLTEGQNAALARAMTNGLGPRLDWLLTGSNIRNFGSSLAMLVEGLPVLKAKVFHPRGRVMYSTVPGEINTEIGDDPAFKRTLAGRTASTLSFQHEVTTFTGVAYNRHVVASYWPIFDKAGKVTGILEISADVTDRLAKIQRSTLILIGILLGVATVIYGGMYWVVRRAENIIRAQHTGQLETERRLIENSQKLAQEHAERLQVEDALSEVSLLLERRVEERTSELTQEIAERRRAEEGLHEAQRRLLRQANIDALTGLPNRTLFLDRLTQVLNRAKREGELAAVLFLDLDNFKDINDTLGHAAGDELLRRAGQRLTDCVRGEDSVSRLGGDEFTIVLQGLENSNNAAVVSSKILQAFRVPFDVGGHEMIVRVSIGIAVYPADGNTPDTLLKNADAALYQAKDEGRDAYRFFTAEINAQAMEQMRLETHLRLALERREFLLHFQPIFDVATGRPVAVEAILCWESAELGLVPSARFIPVAEEKGLFVAINEWVIEAACREVKSWQEQGAEGLRVYVSVFGRQFREGRILATVSHALDASGLASDCLELELTEGLFLEDENRVRDMLAELSAKGVRLCIDGFGNGYSPLNFLKHLLVTSIKIDRAFLSDITRNSKDARITRAIIDMAHTLGLKVIGEGVEENAQVDFLRAARCNLVQGDLLSPPISAEDARDFFIARLAVPATLAAGS